MLQARHILVLVFLMLLFFSCFSHEFMVHINKNVSFHHVGFLHLSRYKNLHRKCLNYANVYFLYLRKDGNFFLSFILYLNIFKSFKTIRYYKTCNLLFHTLLSSAITAITFPYFLSDKERYNPLDYILMGVMEQIKFFFFDVEDATRNQKLCVKWCEILKNKVCRLRRKKRLKST